MKIAIIGTAGRKRDLTLDNYNNMYKWLVNHLSKYDKKDLHLISGGAAWADHLAVRYYLDNPDIKLTLYLPTEWDKEKKNYIQTTNTYCAGRSSNNYHNKFNKITKINSFEQINTAINLGAIVDISKNNFFVRNDKIAKNCDILIAFTFDKDEPTDGGSKYTWNKASNKNRIHVCIDNI